MKKIILFVAALILAGPVYAAPPPAITVEAAPVTIGHLERTIEAVGNLISSESVVVRPEISGRVTAIEFEEGADAKAGVALIKLDDSIYRAQLAQAQAALTLSKANFARASELYRSETGSGRVRDEAQAKLSSDQAAIELSRAQLEKTVMKAPFNGIVGLRQVSIGDYVTPGQALVNFESIDPLKVDFRVAEMYLGQLKPGQKIDVSVDAFPGKVFGGEVYAIDPKVDSTGRTVVLRARLPNPDRVLRPGLFARVKLIVSESHNALLVDEQAMIPQGEEQFVYRIVDGKAVMTKIKTGLRQGGKVEITEGLSASDMVITAGQMKLRDGVAVKALSPPAGSEPESNK